MITANFFLHKKNIIRGIEYAHDMYARPGNGVTEYHFFGKDPRCFFQLRRKPGRGWYTFNLGYLSGTGTLDHPKLYFDTGRGYYEADCIELKAINGVIKRIFYIPQKAKSIRFDPTDISRV